jgi:small nuclear ribonucleoprotein
MPDAPTHLLERMIDQRVTLSLKDARQLTGRLLGVDEHMNLVLDDAEETTPELSRRLGRVVLRGSNLVAVHSPLASPAKSH